MKHCNGSDGQKCEKEQVIEKKENRVAVKLKEVEQKHAVEDDVGHFGQKSHRHEPLSDRILQHQRNWNQTHYVVDDKLKGPSRRWIVLLIIHRHQIVCGEGGKENSVANKVSTREKQLTLDDRRKAVEFDSGQFVFRKQLELLKNAYRFMRSIISFGSN